MTEQLFSSVEQQEISPEQIAKPSPDAFQEFIDGSYGAELAVSWREFSKTQEPYEYENTNTILRMFSSLNDYIKNIKNPNLFVAFQEHLQNIKMVEFLNKVVENSLSQIPAEERGKMKVYLETITAHLSNNGGFEQTVLDEAHSRREQVLERKTPSVPPEPSPGFLDRIGGIVRGARRTAALAFAALGIIGAGAIYRSHDLDPNNDRDLQTQLQEPNSVPPNAATLASANSEPNPAQADSSPSAKPTEPKLPPSSAKKTPALGTSTVSQAPTPATSANPNVVQPANTGSNSNSNSSDVVTGKVLKPQAYTLNRNTKEFKSLETMFAGTVYAQLLNLTLDFQVPEQDITNEKVDLTITMYEEFLKLAGKRFSNDKRLSNYIEARKSRLPDLKAYLAGKKDLEKSLQQDLIWLRAISPQKVPVETREIQGYMPIETPELKLMATNGAKPAYDLVREVLTDAAEGNLFQTGEKNGTISEDFFGRIRAKITEHKKQAENSNKPYLKTHWELVQKFFDTAEKQFGTIPNAFTAMISGATPVFAEVKGNEAKRTDSSGDVSTNSGDKNPSGENPSNQSAPAPSKPAAPSNSSSPETPATPSVTPGAPEDPTGPHGLLFQQNITNDDENLKYAARSDQQDGDEYELQEGDYEIVDEAENTSLDPLAEQRNKTLALLGQMYGEVDPKKQNLEPETDYLTDLNAMLQNGHQNDISFSKV